MNRNNLLRLTRLEENAAAAAEQSEISGYDVRKAMMAVVAAHVGQWQETESFAEALSRGLEIELAELKRSLSERPDWLWDQTAKKLADILNTSDEASKLDCEVELLFTMYDAIPDQLKTQAGLLPLYADYLV